MKVLFAVSNEEISESIVKKYQKEYKQIISYKNVYYFNAILKELQKDKTYDRIVIGEDLEAFTNTQYDQIDKFIFDKLDSISDEASNVKGDDTPIILICSDRRTKGEPMLVKLFGIGIYDAVIGNDRSVDEVCKLINRPRTKKEAKSYYKIDSEDVVYQAENENDVSEMEIQNIVAHYKRLGKNEERYIDSFNNIAAQYNDTQLRIITKFLPLNVRAVLEEKSPKYQKIMSFNNTVSDSLRKAKNGEEDGPSQILLKSKNRDTILSKPVVIPSAVNMNGTKKLARQKSVETVPQSYGQQTPNQGSNQLNTNLQQSMRQPNPKPQQPVAQSYTNPEPLIEGLEDFDEIEEIPQKVIQPVTQEPVEMDKQEVVQPVKRGRGRPRKNPIAAPENTATTTQPAKRGRGRPRKNPAPVPEVQQPLEEDVFLPGLGAQEQEEEDTDENFLPGFYDVDTPVSQPNPLKQTEPETFLPGFDEEDEEDDDDIFGQEDMILPGLGEQEIEEQQPKPRVIRNSSTAARNVWNQCLSFK